MKQKLDDGIDAKDAQSLLLKSSELGKKVTKKQLLKQLRRKEELGIPLTQEEMGILYVKYEAPSTESFPDQEKGLTDANEVSPSVPVKKKKNKKKKNKRKSTEDNDTILEEGSDVLSRKEEEPSTKKVKSSIPSEEAESSTKSPSTSTEEATKGDQSVDDKPKQSYAEMMFAGLSSLKTKSDSQNVPRGSFAGCH